MSEKALPVGGKRLQALADQVADILAKQPEEARRHSDRVVCITRFLCAQYTRTHGSNTIPVKDLPLIYAGAALHDMGHGDIPDVQIAAGQADEAALNAQAEAARALLDQLAGQCGLDEHEKEIVGRICMKHHEIHLLKGPADAAKLYTQLVALAECYDALTMTGPEPCNHARAMERILSGECGGFDPVLVRCMEEAYRELQALLECAGNHDRIVLLQNIYRGDRRHYWLRKRLMDVIASSLGLLVLSPLFLLISLLIVIDDPKGGPFFKQTRVGRHKKYFKMYKFRTMCVDAEAKKEALERMNEKDGPVFKIARDPRITRIGHFLRSTSLDELPQLLNILKGQMTLVGPRPPLPQEVGNYTRYDEMRLSVTPGLTCVWQVQPQRDDIPFDKWVDMDLAYIGTRSLWLDIGLIIKTVFAVFRRHGS